MSFRPALKGSLQHFLGQRRCTEKLTSKSFCHIILLVWSDLGPRRRGTPLVSLSGGGECTVQLTAPPGCGLVWPQPCISWVSAKCGVCTTWKYRAPAPAGGVRIGSRPFGLCLWLPLLPQEKAKHSRANERARAGPVQRSSKGPTKINSKRACGQQTRKIYEAEATATVTRPGGRRTNS